MAGPTVRTDLVDVYVFCLPDAGAQPTGCAVVRHHGSCALFLQMRRAQEPMAATWQPVMGHIRSGGETATEAALRELDQETGFRPGAGLLDFWQLESVSPYFLASQDCVVLSPCFAAQVAADREPLLNGEHDAFRWVRLDDADRRFVWPGQRAAIDQVARDILPAVTDGRAGIEDTVCRLLRIDLRGSGP